MKSINWKVIFDMNDEVGLFTHQIKWIPPENSGFIVQYVELDDPLHIIKNYEKPYYEAWKVEKGKVLHEGTGSDEYDDCFSNEGDYQITRQFAIDTVQTNMKKNKVAEAFISYNCLIYWVEEGSNAYNEVGEWGKGYDIGISMARELRASYIRPKGLKEGRNRFYKATFKQQA